MSASDYNQQQIGPLGATHERSFATDPKHLGFVLARYHFVARMLEGKKRVLEVGCGDGTGAMVVLPCVGQLICSDVDISLMQASPIHNKVSVYVHDMIVEPLDGFDAIYCLDVLEHIEGASEYMFLRNISVSLNERGVFICGTPSKESQPYASYLSKKLHVNCKTEDELRATLHRHFSNVFMFGMNDCTLHTGFGPMCHYRLAVCV